MADSFCLREPTRVFLWSLPRSLSTAVTKCLSYIEGMEVWFEPYTVCYDNVTLMNPQCLAGDSKMEEYRRRMAILYQRPRKKPPLEKSATMFETETFKYAWVRDQLEIPERTTTKFVLVKDMPYAVEGLSPGLWLPSAVPCKHSFIIRHPLPLFTSYKRSVMKVLGKTDSADVDITTDCPIYSPQKYYQQMHDMWVDLQQETGQTPVVVEAGELLANPEKILSKYCDSVGFPFHSGLMQWDSGIDVCRRWRMCHDYFDETHVDVWLREAFSSTQFNPVSTAQMAGGEIDEDIRRCVDLSMPFYNAMAMSSLN